MKNLLIQSKFSLLTLLVASMAFLASCGDKPAETVIEAPAVDSSALVQEPVAEVVEDQKKLEDYLYSNKEELIALGKAELERVNAEIEQLEAQLKANAAQLTKSVKAEREKSIADLKLKRDALKQNMEKLQNSTEAAWEELKLGGKNVSDDLKAALEKAKAEFGSEGAAQ